MIARPIPRIYKGGRTVIDSCELHAATGDRQRLPLQSAMETLTSRPRGPAASFFASSGEIVDAIAYYRSNANTAEPSLQKMSTEYQKSVGSSDELGVVVLDVSFTLEKVQK